MLWACDPAAVYRIPPLLLLSVQLYNLSVFITELRVKHRQLLLGLAAGGRSAPHLWGRQI